METLSWLFAQTQENSVNANIPIRALEAELFGAQCVHTELIAIGELVEEYLRELPGGEIHEALEALLGAINSRAQVAKVRWTRKRSELEYAEYLARVAR